MRLTSRWWPLGGCLLMACAACQTPHEMNSGALLKQKLRTVTVADGISQAEAQIIGECYFAQNVGCGVFWDVSDGGDRWCVNAGVGAASLPVKGFYIEKRTGKTVSPIGPSYDNPWEIIP